MKYLEWKSINENDDILARLKAKALGQQSPRPVQPQQPVVQPAPTVSSQNAYPYEEYEANKKKMLELEMRVTRMMRDDLKNVLLKYNELDKDIYKLGDAEYLTAAMSSLKRAYIGINDLMIKQEKEDRDLYAGVKKRHNGM